MSWIFIDHNIHRHPKFRGMPVEEFVIWHEGLCYSAEFWTDGLIPASDFLKENSTEIHNRLTKSWSLASNYSKWTQVFSDS
jgi:hypothetical protein